MRYVIVAAAAVAVGLLLRFVVIQPAGGARTAVGSVLTWVMFAAFIVAAVFLWRTIREAWRWSNTKPPAREPQP